MEILAEDPRRGAVKVKVEDDSDLWILHTIVSRGDLVTARTTREVKAGDERRSSSRRIPMTLTLKVEYTEFQPFTGRLRIHGVIVEGPERFGLKGSHHTLSIGLGSELTIQKEKWSRAVLKKLRGRRRLPGKVVVAAVDYDEAAVGVLYDYGLRIVYSRELRLPGKDSPDRGEILKRRLEEAARMIVEVASSTGSTLIIVAGPGFLKDELASMVRRESSGVRGVTVKSLPSSTGGERGVREVLRRDEIRSIIRELQVVEEQRVLGEFMRLLVKSPGMVAYGVEEVLRVARLGAVDKVMVLDEMLRSYDEGVRGAVEEILEHVDRYGGRVMIFSSHGEAGSELRGLGGVAAILRYKVQGETSSS